MASASLSVSHAVDMAGLACSGSHAAEVVVRSSRVQARALAVRDSKRAPYSERVMSGLECCSSGSESADLRTLLWRSGKAQIPRAQTAWRIKVKRQPRGSKTVQAVLAEDHGLGVASAEGVEEKGVKQLEVDQQGNPAGVVGFSDNLPGTGGDSVGYSAKVSSRALVGSQVGAQVLAAEAPYQPKFLWYAKSPEEERQLLDQWINGGIVIFAAGAAVAKIFTIDYEYWTGWTLFEIIRVAPHHNWQAYEAMLESNPVLAKMCISGVVYTLGDWIAQCYEGRKLLGFDRARMVRSGLVGFCLHGSLSHYYYHFCEWLFPFEGWGVVPLKVAFDQTIWSGIWNSIYYVTLGMLRLENPANIWKELKATFFPLLTAGWKLWPLAHIVTYGFVPLEQRLLWVDMVELVWVTILSMMSNEKAEGRKIEGGDVLALQPAGEEAGAAAPMLSQGEEAAVSSILWPADLRNQEYIIEDSKGVRRLEKSADMKDQA